MVHPPFRFHGGKHSQPVFLMADFFQFVPSVIGRESLDGLVFLGILESRPGALIQFPPQARHQAGGPEQAGRIFDEPVVANQTQLPGFDVGDAIQRIHQQAVRMLVERQGHGIGGEVAAAQILKNRVPVVYGFAGLGVFLAAGARDLDRNPDRETEEQGP